MKQITGLAIICVAIGLTGCMNDQTEAMAQSCQSLLDTPDEPAPRTFIEDAEARVTLLGKPQNKLLAYAREIQDPDAMKHKPALEHCLLQLKYRQASKRER